MIQFIKRIASSVLTPPTGKVTFFVDTEGLPKVKDENGDVSDFMGLQGIQGTQGLSAYEVAINNGYTGTESQWLTSLVGSSGTSNIVSAHQVLPDNYSIIVSRYLKINTGIKLTIGNNTQFRII